MQKPQDIVEAIEWEGQPPECGEDCFSGYGVMGVPFSSGHVLCLRRFPVNSVGLGYTSVWHRTPEGCWTFIQDVEVAYGCTRYFGSAVERVVVQDIRIEWEDAYTFTVQTRGHYDLLWKVGLQQTAVSRMLNTVSALIPDKLWRNTALLKMIGKAGGRVLGSGQLNLTGNVPNGQRFAANPRYLFMIPTSEAKLCGQDLGQIAPLERQANLGDVWIPQYGRFFIGDVFMETFDPVRHVRVASRVSESGSECFSCF